MIVVLFTKIQLQRCHTQNTQNWISLEEPEFTKYVNKAR